MYLVTKAVDGIRPVIDTSGNFHVITDIYDIHDYEQNVEKFKEHYRELANDKNKIYENFPDRQTYGGQPYFISEYGGIAWGGEKIKAGVTATDRKRKRSLSHAIPGLQKRFLKIPMFLHCATLSFMMLNRK